MLCPTVATDYLEIVPHDLRHCLPLWVVGKPLSILIAGNVYVHRVLQILLKFQIYKFRQNQVGQ